MLIVVLYVLHVHSCAVNTVARAKICMRFRETMQVRVSTC